MSFGGLHRAYNQFGKRKYEEIHEFPDFIRMATELGAIGRLVRGTSEYNSAVFEYSEPHKLLITSIDAICIHPAFSNRYRVASDALTAPRYTPVYPFATDPRL